MFGRTWSGSVFILGRPPPKASQKTETPDGSRMSGLLSGALVGRQPRVLAAQRAYNSPEGAGLHRMGS